ncbi:MAG: hypothetical protein QOJ09_1144 [Actinomycetota bacterium]|nr:hypothetical protein [Actinomycetota bacterium]
MRRRLWPVAVGVLVLAGIVLRIVFLRGPWGTVDSDEAVVGLMARAMRAGHWRAFYWGQHYAGTQETALVAAAGASRAALKIVPAALSAVVSVLTWRVGRRVVEERVAQAAALLCWVAPGPYTWWSTKERGFYWVSLALGLVLVLSAQRLATGRRPRADGVALGLAAGLGFWASPTVLYFAVPTGLWLLARRHRPWKGLVVAVPAAVVGALPWLVHNVGHGWPSLDRPSQPEQVGYVSALGRLLWRAFPMALNLRYPISERWLVPKLAALAYLGLGACFIVAVIRRRSRPALLLAFLGTFPFIYAWFPGAWFVGEGRYVVFAVPVVALAVAWLVRRPEVVLAIAAVSAALSFVVVRPMGPEQPRRIGEDLAALRSAGVDHLWADYWNAYRLGFSSGGWLVASSAVSSRERSVYDAVRRDRTPAFLFPHGDPRATRLVSALMETTRVVHTPHFDVVLADGPVDPATLPPGWVP